MISFSFHPHPEWKTDDYIYKLTVRLPVVPRWLTRAVPKAIRCSCQHTMRVEIDLISFRIGSVSLGYQVYRLIPLLPFAKTY